MPASDAERSEPEEVSPFSREAWSKRLLALLIAHVVLTTGCVFLSILWPDILIALPVIELYQFILVSMWIMLGPWDLEGRALGLLGFNAYMIVTTLLAATLTFGLPRGGIGDAIGRAIIVAAGTSLVCGVPFLLLFIWLELRQVPAEVDQSFASRMGIRHLMGMTLICGLIIAATGAIKDGARLPALVAAAILGAPWLAGAAAIVWAILSPRFAWVRLAIAAMANASAAALSVTQFQISLRLLLLMLPGIGLLVASLFVMRSDGYRLMRRETSPMRVGSEES